MTRRQKKTLFRILCAAVLTACAWIWSPEGWLELGVFAIPYLLIGYDVLWSAIRNILHGQVFDEQFLMALATLGAFGTRDYKEAVAVMLFYQVGELFQGIAVGRSRKSIAALMDIRPDYAVVLRDGEEVTVSPEEVLLGETVIVKPGEKIPLDGVITEGVTAVNTAALTGESLPVDRAPGEKVISGSINLTGVIRMRSESVYENSTVAKILELVENSSQKKARVESFITRFARWYTPCVVLGAVLLAVLPPIFTGQPFSHWLQRALVFLVVSCPCALVVSVPLSFFGGIGGASREGVLIKGANYLEALSKVDTVVFDKTGTLTKGSFAVDEVCPNGMEKEELLSIAAAAESYSHHPVAESIVKAYAKPVNRESLGAVRELAGLGVQAEVGGKNLYVGNGKLMTQVGADWQRETRPGTVIHVSEDTRYLGYLLISDEIKQDSARAVTELKKLGIRKTVMLTGDNEQVASDVGGRIGIDEVFSGLLPAQKVERVEELLKQGSRLAFVGDGINDAPVLTRADVGIAMGALGSDAAIESADVVLMDDKPSKLPYAIRIARKTMRIVRQNIVFALSVKGIILLLGALGYAGMWIAVFGDVGVMVLAVFNAMRALWKEKNV